MHSNTCTHTHMHKHTDTGCLSKVLKFHTNRYLDKWQNRGSNVKVSIMLDVRAFLHWLMQWCQFLRYYLWPTFAGWENHLWLISISAWEFQDNPLPHLLGVPFENHINLDQPSPYILTCTGRTPANTCGLYLMDILIAREKEVNKRGH